MSTKHTPGPWFVKFVGGAFLVRAEKRHAKDWRVVAQVVLHEREDEANARLIAAAPDLLELVRAIANDASAYQWHAAAHAAIAKAEGHD